MNKLLIAFTSGLILGILYAPSKGRKTRNKIAEMGTSLMDGWNTISETIVGKIDNMRDGIDEMDYKEVIKTESVAFDRGNTIL